MVVSDDVEGRGYYQYDDDGKVYCLTVDGNSNFLTQRLSHQRLTSGKSVVRALSVYVGNCQEGIDAIFPHMTRQVLRPPFADFMQLLLKGTILLKHMQHRQDAFARQLVDDSVTRPGCVVLAVAGDRMAALTGQTLAMAAWKTQHSLALMIPEQERTSLTNLLTHRQTHSNHAATESTNQPTA